MFFIFENSWFWCSSRDTKFPIWGFDGISAYSFILRDYDARISLRFSLFINNIKRLVCFTIYIITK